MPHQHDKSVRIRGMNFLYVSESSSQHTYDACEGELDVNRLLEGADKIFRLPHSGQAHKKKKILVFNDPTFLGWSAEKVRNVQGCFDALVAEGFTILYPSRLLDTCMVWSYEQITFERISATFNAGYAWAIQNNRELIDTSAELEQYAENQLLFLDTHLIEQLIDSLIYRRAPSDKLQLDFTELLSCNLSGMDMERMQAVLTQRHPGNEWVVNEYSPEITEIVKSFEERRQGTVRWSINQVTLANNQETTAFIALLTEGVIKEENFDSNHVSVTINAMEKLEAFMRLKHAENIGSLTFKNINFDGICVALLSQFNHIRHLSFDSCNKIDAAIEALSSNWSKLESLCINNITNSSKVILERMLVGASSTLEKLQLRRQEDDLLQGWVSVRKLERLVEIELEHCIIDKPLFQLLTARKVGNQLNFRQKACRVICLDDRGHQIIRVWSLNAIDIESSGYVRKISSLNLERLQALDSAAAHKMVAQEIDFQHIDGETGQFHKILEKQKYLRSLILGEAAHLTDRMRFERLVKLAFAKDVTWEDLKRAGKVAPILRRLRIDESNLGSSSDQIDLSFPHLEVLNLFEVKSGLGVSKILRGIGPIQEFSLSLKADLSCNHENVSQEKLKKLLIQADRPYKIDNLLSWFPNLKILGLTNVSSDIDVEAWKKFSLWKGLTHLEVTGERRIFDDIVTNMPLEHIVSVAVATTGESGDLTEPANIAHWIHRMKTSQEGYYSSLKEIRVTGVETPGSILGLIQHSPNLTQLLMLFTNPLCEALLNCKDFLNLEYLNITQSRIDGHLLTKLLEKMPNLRVLSANGASINGVFHIPETLVHLRDLYLQYTVVTTGHGEKLDARLSSALARGNFNCVAAEAQAPADLVDLDQKSQTQSFNETYLFVGQDGEHPPPSSYRDYVYNHVDKLQGVFDRSQCAFQLMLNGDVSLEDCSNIRFSDSGLDEIFSASQMKTKKFFLAKTSALISSQWTYLSSLDANEKMTHFYAEGLSKKDIEVKYCLLTNRYCVRYCGTGQRTVNLQYIITVPEKTPALKSALAQRVKEYSRINNQHLPDSCISGDANYWVEQFVRTRAGSCRHKSIAFFEETKNDVFAIRYVKNISHAYVEVKQTERSGWVKCDLGGMSVQSHISHGLFQMGQGSNQPAELKRSHAQMQRSSVPVNAAFAHEHEKATVTLCDFKRALSQKYISQNVLLNVSDGKAAWDVQYLLREASRESNLPTFYIHSPDALKCTGRRVVRGNNNDGQIINGPYGPLYDFIVMSQNRRCILIVNFIDFTAEEIVRFNTMLDKVRKIDGILLGQTLTVLGLYHADHPHAYNGSDFYSRFHERINLGVDVDHSYDMYEPESNTTSHAAVIDINLFESDSWKSILFGDWEMSSQGFHFHEGLFFQALKNNHSIRLHYPPVNDPEFNNFIITAKLEGRVMVAGAMITLPNDLSITLQKGSPLVDPSDANKDLSDTKYESFRIVCPHNFTRLFKSYEIVAGNLVTVPGWVEQAREEGQLNVILSPVLTVPSRNRLAAFCVQHGVRLNCISFSQVALSPQHKDFINNIKVTDLYQSLLEHRRHHPDDVVIDCTHLTPGDLLGALVNNSTEAGFSFTQTDGLIRQVLSSGKNLVLTGNLSFQSEVALFTSDLYQSFQGKRISLLFQKELVFMDFFFGKNIVETSCAQQDSIQESSPVPSLPVMAARSHALRQAMSSAPIILLTGPTGVGKSTFMLDHYAHEQDIELHVGESSIEAWLSSQTVGQKKVLFIDEANIATSKRSHWTEFAGMFNHSPPSILFKGTIHTLTSDHVVVFAGNPAGYGGERYVPALFRNYPVEKVHFERLPIDYIAQQVLAPILGYRQNYSDICSVFMQAYQQVLDLKPTEPLITPRDLEHMAHLYMIHNNAEQAVCTVLKHLLSPRDYERIVKHTHLPILIETQVSPHFYLPESRIELASRLNEFLSIRKDKQYHFISGGLGGILIEGAPGIGKSEQVLAQFAAHRLVEGKDYFVVPSSASYDEKIEILTTAFHAGAIVMIDELNSSPALERFFNDALSGKLNGVPAKNPGFLLVATQNPTNHAGRRELSVALRRRLMHCKVEPYTRDELVTILERTHHLDKVIAQEIVSDFYRANQQRKTPLTCRDLLRRVEDAILGIWMTTVHRPNSNMLFDRLSRFYLGDLREGSAGVGPSSPLRMSNDNDDDDDDLRADNPSPAKKIRLTSAAHC